MKRLLYKNFTWWISNDPSKWWIWSVKYAEWVEVKTDSWKVTLSRWTYSTNKVASNDPVVWYEIYDSTKFLRLHRSWKIANIFLNDVDNNSYVADLDWTARNIWSFTTIAWPRGFIMTSNKLYKWNYDTSAFSLWIYADSGWWLVDESWFSATWTWSVWANWSISWWQATHTSWSTDVLSQTLSPTSWKTYRFEVRCWTITADSCQLRLWWVTQKTFTSADSWKTIVFLYTAASWSVSLEFVPFSWFVWSFDYVNWQEYTLTSQDYNFNEQCPYLIEQNFIYVWNGNKITEIDATSSTWVISDVCSIDLDYTIKWLTRIWDQIFIYASNGSNSKQYLWDWVTETPLRSITWVDKNIVNVANFANEDYVVTKNQYSYKTWLWKVAWYQLLKLFTNEENNNASNERIYFDVSYTNAIETVWDNLLIPWADWIYSYWNHTPWLPFALVKEYLHNGWEITAISYDANNSNRITFAYNGTINNVYGNYETLIQITQWYATRTDLAWFIEIHNIEWESLSNKKNIEKILVWYKLPTNTKINVYTKNEDRTIKYANIPYQYTTIPTIWAVYTFSGNTYTIYAITDMWNNSCILHTTYTWTWTWVGWTFTKTSWTWDATFYCEKVRYWFKLIKTITDTTIRREQILTSEPFFELSVWIELLSWNSSVTPELNNFYVYFNETEDV